MGTHLWVLGCFSASAIDSMSGLGARPVLHTRRPNGTADIDRSLGPSKLQIRSRTHVLLTFALFLHKQLASFHAFDVVTSEESNAFSRELLGRVSA